MFAQIFLGARGRAGPRGVPGGVPHYAWNYLRRHSGAPVAECPGLSRIMRGIILMGIPRVMRDFFFRAARSFLSTFL